MTLSPLQRKITAFIFLIASINYLTGCKYYKPVATDTYNNETKESSLKELNAKGKYFILRKGEHSYALSNIVLDDAKMTLTGTAGTVPPNHMAYASNPKKGHYAYSKSESVVLTEVHIYTSDTTEVDTSAIYTFPLSDVKKIEVIEYDKKKSTSHTVEAIVFSVVGAALVVAIIAAASYQPPPPTTSTSGSCPYISTFDGENYNLQGEIYSASIYQSLQKDDYLPLQLKSVNGDYNIKISNDLPEIQHTDFADLLVADHDRNVTLLVNPDGRIFSISNPQSPEAATLNHHIDVKNELLHKDNNNCLFKDDSGARAAEDLFISFRNDSKSKKGKLILSGKTSAWMLYLFDEFTKGFGSSYDKWEKQQQKKSVADLEKWINEQNIPLTISLKTADGWREIQKLKVVGPLMDRDMAIPIDLPGNGLVELKISGGYLFWELDYAAMDYTPDAAFTLHTIKPYEAIDEKGANVLPVIAEPDKQYLIQPDNGNVTIVKYKSISPPQEGMIQTFFLHSSGYYTHIRHYNGSPKVAFLKSFEQPGALAAFSRQKFAQALNSIAKK